MYQYVPLHRPASIKKSFPTVAAKPWPIAGMVGKIPSRPGTSLDTMAQLCPVRSMIYLKTNTWVVFRSKLWNYIAVSHVKTRRSMHEFTSYHIITLSLGSIPKNGNKNKQSFAVMKPFHMSSMPSQAAKKNIVKKSKWPYHIIIYIHSIIEFYKYIISLHRHLQESSHTWYTNMYCTTYNIYIYICVCVYLCMRVCVCVRYCLSFTTPGP